MYIDSWFHIKKYMLLKYETSKDEMINQNNKRLYEFYGKLYQCRNHVSQIFVSSGLNAFITNKEYRNK